MIGSERVLAVIPARGGSKGVPRKNIRPVAGLPLIAWSIAAARASRHVDRVIVSTDDEEIARVAREHGAEVPFMRPSRLAQDDTPGVMPVLHALDELPGHDWVVLLQPTSPLRIAGDIDGALERCIETGAPACVSVSDAESHPAWTYRMEEGRLRPFLDAPAADCRQDLPAAYALNGAVYVARCDWLRGTRTFLAAETAGYVMPGTRSLDIDTEWDLAVLEGLVATGRVVPPPLK